MVSFPTDKDRVNYLTINVNEETMMTFGKRFKNLRLINRYSQAALAKEIGVTREAISYWENDITDKVDVDAYLKATHLFNVNPYEVRFGI